MTYCFNLKMRPLCQTLSKTFDTSQKKTCMRIDHYQMFGKCDDIYRLADKLLNG